MSTATSPSSNAHSVLRVARDHMYKTVHLKGCEDDDRLSWKAVGLLWYLLSRPDGWTFRRADIEKRHADGRHSVSSGLDELKECGYLRIQPIRQDDGTFAGWCWMVSEVPRTDWPDGDDEDPDDDEETPAAQRNSPKAGFPAFRSPGFPQTGVYNNKKYYHVEGKQQTHTAEMHDGIPALRLMPLDPNDSERPKGWKDDEWHLFRYWRQRRADAMGKNGGPPMQPTDTRRGKIRARLREGYTPEMLRQAIDGCLSSERNVQGGYTDITLICRDQQKVEQYRAWKNNGGPPDNDNGKRDTAAGIQYDPPTWD